MANAPQSFASHTQWTPMQHFLTLPLTLVVVIWAGVCLFQEPGNEQGLIFVGALTLFFTNFAARVAALRVQDRVIRLEERLRFARILPSEMQSRIEEITPSQMVGLRFASDADVPALVAKVLANPAMTQKEIKMAVREWRADYLRA